MKELLEIFIPPLNRLGLDYMVTGSVSAMLYGEGRLTNDVDIVLTIQRNHAKLLLDAFPESDFYLPPQEVIEAEIIRRQRGHLNIIHQASQLRADIYLFAGDPFQRWAFDHSIVTGVESIPVRFAPVEYVIIMKLDYFREGGSEKHLRDIHGILAAGEPVRTADVAGFVRTRGLEELWQKHVLSKLAGEVK
jgi:hypothetical protein